LAYAFVQGLLLQNSFANINTDSPDLSATKAAKTKILHYHGLGDQLIMPQGSINYYTRALALDPGLASYDRLFLIPGMAHDSTFKSAASIDPATNANTAATKVPLPRNALGILFNGTVDTVVPADTLFNALRAWVEKGLVPSRIELASADNSVTMPICAYPAKAKLTVAANPKTSASYTCQ
jgi:tannase/feruloyl esterase